MIVDKLNRPLRDLRISVTDRCNFRCPYCMPKEIYGERYSFLPRDAVLTFEEIARVSRILVGLGVSKIRLTGGEPLVRNQVDRLVAMLAKIDGLNDLAMTSNGYLLAQTAHNLKDAGLQRITVSLDSLDENIFKQMNGRGFGTRRVIEGIEAAQRAGLNPIKINSVVQRGVNDETIVDLARFARERGYIVRFIEYMDVGNINGWQPTQVVPADEIVAKIGAQMPLKPIDGNYDSEVAERYAYVDGGGEIGVIASVTRPFCGGCTRLRLSPEGEIVTCLFSSSGTDLRGPMRAGATDNELEAIVRRTWGARVDRYSELRSHEGAKPRKKVEMYHIGG